MIRRRRGAAVIAFGMVGLMGRLAVAAPPTELPADPFTPPDERAAVPPVDPSEREPAKETRERASEAEEESREESSEGEGESRDVVVGSFFSEGLPRVAGSAHVVGERELETYEHDDIHQVVGAVPGVYIRGEDGYGLRPNIGLRGANSDRSAKVTLMEDGILLAPAPYAAPAAYYFPMTTRMVGVEVFKGPAAIRHGPNTVGGAINLRTRAIPTTPSITADLAGGRFGYAKAHVYGGTTYKGFGVLLEVAHVQSRGFKQLDGGGDTGFGKNEAMLKLGYRTPAGRSIAHVVELKGGFANERSLETYLGLTDTDFESTPYRRYAGSQRDVMKWWRTQGQATWVVSDRGQLELESRIYRHDLSRAWTKLNRFRDGPDLHALLASPDSGQNAVLTAILRGEEDSTTPGQALMVGTNDRRYVSQGAVSVFRWRPVFRRWSNELEIGLRLHQDSIERNHTEDPFLMTTGVLVPEESDTLTTALNRGATLAAAFHVHDAITILDRLTLAPGLRVEVISTQFDDELADSSSYRIDVVPIPGIGAHVVATEWLGIFAGVHRGFSPVSPGQPAEVKPESSINYELGTRALWKGIHGEVVGFFNDYQNLTGECTFSGGCVDDLNEQFNAGKVHVWGIESLLRYARLVSSRFHFEVGAHYTWTGSRFRNTFVSALPQFGEVETGDALAYVPPHIFGGDAGVGGKIWDISVKGQYTSAMRDVPGQGAIPATERIDGYFLLDIAASVTVFRRLRLYGVLDNATASPYMTSRRPFGARPGAPLSFVFGVKAHLPFGRDSV